MLDEPFHSCKTCPFNDHLFNCQLSLHYPPHVPKVKSILFCFFQDHFSSVIIRAASLQEPTFHDNHNKHILFSFFKDHLQVQSPGGLTVAQELCKAAHKDTHFKTMMWISSDHAVCHPVSPPSDLTFQDHHPSTALLTQRVLSPWRPKQWTCILSPSVITEQPAIVLGDLSNDHTVSSHCHCWVACYSKTILWL